MPYLFFSFFPPLFLIPLLFPWDWILCEYLVSKMIICNIQFSPLKVICYIISLSNLQNPEPNKKPAEPRTPQRISLRLNILQLLWSLQHRACLWSRTFSGYVFDSPSPTGNRPKADLLKISSLLDFSNKILYENKTPMKLCKSRCCFPSLLIHSQNNLSRPASLWMSSGNDCETT